MTPAIARLLQRIHAGETPDNRSRSTVDAAIALELLALDGKGRPQLTPAGRTAIARRPGVTLDEWLELRHDPKWKPRRA